MTRKWPWAVTIARWVNVIQLVICSTIFVATLAIAAPNVIKGSFPPPSFYLVLFFAAAFAFVFLWLIVGLGRLKAEARWAQIYVSAVSALLGMLSFPSKAFFLVTHILILCLMFDKNTMKQFIEGDSRSKKIFFTFAVIFTLVLFAFRVFLFLGA